MKKLLTFDITRISITDYFFIAHLFDRVLVGKTNQSPHEELLEAICQDRVLEVHFFNQQKEIFATRFQDGLLTYQTLNHQEGQEDKVITRSYQLEERFKKDGYATLVVKEYIDYDQDHLAYVGKTVLYQLKKAGE